MPHLLRASKRGSGPNRTPRPTHQIQECEQLVVRSNFRLAANELDQQIMEAETIVRVGEIFVLLHAIPIQPCRAWLLQVKLQRMPAKLCAEANRRTSSFLSVALSHPSTQTYSPRPRLVG